MHKLFLYFHTLRHLRAKQVYYRIYYFFRGGLRRITGHGYPLFMECRPKHVCLVAPIPREKSYEGGVFTFLNLTRSFGGSIDWNYPGFGKLWCYHLNYFDFLNQEGMPAVEGLRRIHDFMAKIECNRAGLEPYPTSLRIINWIKFISREAITDDKMDACLYAQAKIVRDNPEYHLLGNHLLENGFALLFAGIYFQDGELFGKGSEIVRSELAEQVLGDGAHFELSPMYHQVILERLLDTVNLLENNNRKGNLLEIMREKAALMLGWLRNMTFANGDIPLLNDAAFGIAPTTEKLFDYAKRLGISEQAVRLSACGYRKIARRDYEMIVDVGPIGPDYIPGHAHSDTFSFVLYRNGRPFIVDTGVSTYEPGALRQSQRSTAAHNTVMVDGMEQSEVWGSFRVARRARVIDLQESADSISAVHDGYRRIGAMHRRTFQWAESQIRIRDEITSRNRHQCRAFFHFHPDVEVIQQDSAILADGRPLHFRGASRVSVGQYHYAPEFNRLIPAKVVEVDFSSELEAIIILTADERR